MEELTMRWPHETASTRRDDHLARTRSLSLWIAGGAIAASLGLATGFGYALPGHSAAATRSQSPTAQSSGPGAGPATTHPRRRHNGQLSAPRQPPSQPASQPVVSSGGS
jgi:hypothetical protein